MMINIMMIHSKSCCSRGATHALPGAGVGQTLPRWPMLFLKKYQSIVAMMMAMVVIVIMVTMKMIRKRGWWSLFLNFF